ncbi:hypothetical protein IEQ34_015477 [Dendrobium chrysotoxum]|uniref:Legume lectin domain-containing protein n=1 Tax=Dendrobium chrysotoxum TaxID=161865 RepID=A0AAV7G056_DENCH|nr:hypothetical protein IEQ34_015477 [Dendrobium chrysotoxum]
MIKLLRCIKDIGISYGCSSHRLNEVLSWNFEKHGGASSMKSKDCIFLNVKLALYALGEEFGKVPLGLLPELSHAFYPTPFPFLNSADEPYSFSTSFVFAIVPHYTKISSEGLTFAISPTPNLYSTLPSQFLGLFNLSSNGQATNHIVVVELDTIEKKEFDDINDNQIGINLNSLTFVVAAPASYAKSSSLFRNLSLISGQTMRIWAEYDAKKMEFNVTLAPLTTPKPVLPLLSYTINLSSVLLSKMYVGFSSSTGVATGSHYILRWSLCLNGREAKLLAFNLMAAGNEIAWRNETAWRSEMAGCIEIETLS